MGGDWSQYVIMYNMEGARMMCVCMYVFIYSISIYSWHFVHINLPYLAKSLKPNLIFVPYNNVFSSSFLLLFPFSNRCLDSM